MRLCHVPAPHLLPPRLPTNRLCDLAWAHAHCARPWVSSSTPRTGSNSTKTGPRYGNTRIRMERASSNRGRRGSPRPHASARQNRKKKKRRRPQPPKKTARQRKSESLLRIDPSTPVVTYVYGTGCSRLPRTTRLAGLECAAQGGRTWIELFVSHHGGMAIYMPICTLNYRWWPVNTG